MSDQTPPQGSHPSTPEGAQPAQTPPELHHTAEQPVIPAGPPPPPQAAPTAPPAAPANPYGAPVDAGQPNSGYSPGYPAAPTFAPPAPAPKKPWGAGKTIATSAIVALLVGGAAGAGGYALASTSGTDLTAGTSGQTGLSIPASDLSPRAGDGVANIAKRMLPTVVSIVVSANGGDSGSGSGFIIRDDGYILTNNHVVAPGADGGDIKVQFNNDEIKDAQIVGRNPSYDLAVLKVEASGLPVASLGNSSNVQVGDTAIAVGSPLGLSGTVTSGIISALNRPVRAGGEGESSFIDAIQTDAAINPGNSGGPLVNGKAEVIGVNSAIASLGASQGSQSGNIGVGFAIPSNTAKRIADEIIATGTSKTPVIGVMLDFQTQSDGATVGSVTAGGPAASAGVKAGDRITAVNGDPIDTPVALITAIRSLNPGDTVTLTVSDGGSSRDIKVTLGSQTD
ncbi:MAG TPA: trypsin-like peptidase domain-containing protein [Actinomycetota bacterium]|nr:trypsin-like peptidase domain-containing protein [Actinomycetota bacterium]